MSSSKSVVAMESPVRPKAGWVGGDVGTGLAKQRHMTDVFFQLLFVGHLGFFGYLGYVNIQSGADPVRLATGQDYQGNFCGTVGQKTNAGATLATLPLLMYTLNIQVVAETAFSTATLQTGGNAAASHAALASALAPALLSSPAVAAATLAEFQSSMNGVCMAACPTAAQIAKVNDPNAVSVTDYRTYAWEGPTSAAMQAAWSAYRTAYPASNASDGLTFNALPFALCPYAPKFCIPLQVPLASIMSLYCVPKVPLPNSGGSAVPSAFGSALGSGFGQQMYDLQSAWLGTLLTVFSSLALGLAFLALLKTCVGFFVWISILVTFLAILASAVVAILYSARCTGQSLWLQMFGLQDLSSANSALNGEAHCVNGFAVADPSQRDHVRYVGYALLAVAGAFALIIIALLRRIRLGIAICKVAAQFVSDNPFVISVPFLQTVLSMCWWTVWVVLTLYGLANVPASAMNLTDTWTDPVQAAQSCGGLASNVYIQNTVYPSVAGASAPTFVYACKQTRFAITPLFAFYVFSLLWVNGYMIALGQMIIAGAAGFWYFLPNSEKPFVRGAPLAMAAYHALYSHAGTAALGSLVMALVEMAQLALSYFAKQAGVSRNPVMKVLLAVLSCVLDFFERVLKFVSLHAYIQTALNGTSFCKSCRNGFFLLLRNAGRVGALHGISAAVRFLGVGLITSLTAFVGWLMLMYLYDGAIASPVMPLALYVVVGFVVGEACMAVFAVAVDTVLHCFVADEEHHGATKTTPTLLAAFIDTHGNTK